MSAAERYRSRPIPTGISVATVRDFVDSFEHLHDLAVAAGDLKDVQRPWMVKAVLATVPPGGSICEIGAGEPLVAGRLADLGYRCTIVDPYDGSGNGPTDLARFAASRPAVRFVPDRFGPGLPELEGVRFDAICSISVLEHLGREAIREVVEGCRLHLRPGGRLLHAIDFVSAGPGAEHHRAMLVDFLGHYGIPEAAVDETIRRAEPDPETYLLSAESHNRWRGRMPYDSFPMRRVMSVQCVL